MIEQFMLPLDRQFDSGFGATACAFHDAARAIDTEDHRLGFGLNGSRLPVFYLYRHANELYLKSVITILHRRFFGDFPRVKRDNFPLITADGKSKRIFQVHSIRHLCSEFRSLLTKKAVEIRAIGRTDWTDVPDRLDELVELIDVADNASTMFRYPMTMDSVTDTEKSAFKAVHPIEAIDEAHRRTREGKPGVKLFAIKNDDDEVVEAFIHDDNPMPEVLMALRELADTISDAQFGMLHEFLSSDQ